MKKLSNFIVDDIVKEVNGKIHENIGILIISIQDVDWAKKSSIVFNGSDYGGQKAQNNADGNDDNKNE